MKVNGNVITAEEGYTLRRISDKMEMGREVALGYIYYINGQKLDAPHLEQPEDFEEVETSDIAIEKKIAEIEAYDTSEKVNSFTYKGVQTWLDKATRVGLMNSTTILLNAGVQTTCLWLNGEQIVMPCNALIDLLSKLEQYALECYNVTEQHKADVRRLTTRERVEEYDITAGYPKRIVVE